MITAVPDQAKINQLRAQLAEEEAKLTKFTQMTEAQRLATEIHDRTCHLEHTEMCGWFYETGWTEKDHAWTHERYLEKAERLLQIATYDEVIEITNILRGI